VLIGVWVYPRRYKELYRGAGKYNGTFKETIFLGLHKTRKTGIFFMTVTTSKNDLYSFFPYYVVGSQESKVDNVSSSGNNAITVQVTANGWFVTFDKSGTDAKTTLRGNVLGILEVDENER
jgi:hypothetical protein